MVNLDFLTDEHQSQIAVWERGRELSAVVRTEAWTIIKDTLQAYSDGATRQLLDMAPGDTRVPTAHAAASALAHQLRCFIEDIESAVNKSDEVPDVIRDVLQIRP